MSYNFNPSSREDALFFVCHQKPLAVIKSIHVRSFNDTITSLYPTLEECERLHHQDPSMSNLATEFVVMALVEAQQLLNVSPKLDGTALRIAAAMILEDYRHLNLADLVLCTKMGIKGRLTEFYGRFDAQVAYDWFYCYNIQRAEARRYYDAGE